MAGGTIRFGVQRRDWRSGTFYVTTNANLDDVYISCRELGDLAHVALHRSGRCYYGGQGIDQETGQVTNERNQWRGGGELAPGLVKPFQIIIPASTVRIPIEPNLPPDIQLVQIPAGFAALGFLVVLLDPKVRSTSWPGALGTPTKAVGNYLMPETGRRLWVVAQGITDLAPPREMLIKLTPEEQEAVRRGTLMGVRFSRASDGSGTLIHGAIDIPADVPGTQAAS